MGEIKSDPLTSSLPLKTAEGVEQSSSLGAHEVHSTPSDPGLNPQLSLTEDQQALKDKFGLPERVCANFDVESQTEVQNFTKDLKDGKFSPNIFKKFVLWLSSKLGGSDYESAVQQFRIETAATKNQDLFKNEEFQESLATAIKSCDGSELPQSLSVVYDLLSAGPEVRRDFFINGLLIPCLDEAHEEISKDEVDVKKSGKKCESFSAINQFCRDNNMMCLEGEKQKVISKLETMKVPLGNLTLKVMYCITTANTNSEKGQYLQHLSEIKKIRPTIERELQTHFNLFNELKGSFIEILQCFGKRREDQIANFRTLEYGLKSIANGVSIECKKLKEGKEEYDWVKSFVPKASEFLLKNPELMWAAMKMKKTNTVFFGSFFLAFINFQGGSDDRTKFFSSVALQAMGNAVETNDTLSGEQVKLLCEGVDLPDLLRNPEKNKDTIDTVLRFVQDRALTNTDPKIFFEDIIPAGISNATYQQLVTFVEQGGPGGQYEETLKVFIKDGRPAQKTSPN